MEPKPRFLARHEILGLEVEARLPSREGHRVFKGIVINETRNMVEIEGDGKVWKIPKKTCKFIFKLPSGVKVHVEGWRIVGRPEDRIKRWVRRW